MTALENISEMRGSQWDHRTPGDAAKAALREQYRREIIRAAASPV